MIGLSGSNGESVPNETMNPLFLFELFHTTVVPALTQNNRPFPASGMSAFTFAEVADLVMSIVHTDEAEPQVFEALHMLSGWSSSHMYLLFFCACAVVELRRMALDNKSTVAPLLSRLSLLVISARLASPRKLCNLLKQTGSGSAAPFEDPGRHHRFSPTRLH